MGERRSNFYGWWMVGCAIICQYVYLSVSGAATGVMLRPVADELGWQSWEFALGSSLSTIVGILSGFVAGRFVDPRGPRLPILLGAMVSAVCLYGFSHQSNLWVFWFYYAVCGLIGWNLFGSLVVNAALAKWFVYRRGWAFARGSIGTSLSGIVTPVALTSIVDAVGWRFGYVCLAGITLIAVLPTAFVMRRTLEDHGLHPDGLLSDAGTPRAHTSEPSLTRN